MIIFYSLSSRSDENLLMMRPTGVVSKNFMGEAITCRNIVLCMVLDARNVACDHKSFLVICNEARGVIYTRQGSNLQPPAYK